MKPKKIAIFGATSHIAKGLIYNFLKSDEFDLHLYTRSSKKIQIFLSSIENIANKKFVIHEGYSDFINISYDVVINCIGVGTLNKLCGKYTNYFTVIEEYDNIIINYLNNNPNSLYISFSSGAVYGKDHTMPVNENSTNNIQVNNNSKNDYYSIARIYSEAKHRAFNNLNIVDLRLFSYFSRFVDLNDGYFITDIIESILKKRVLTIDGVNIIRDYLHPDDLFSMIKKCINTKKINASFDVTSTKPIEKKEILKYFSKKYGLQYKIDPSLGPISATGSKKIYYSNNRNALTMGYKPIFSSMDTIKEESKYLLKGLKRK